MRGSCTSFAIVDGAFKDGSPEHSCNVRGGGRGSLSPGSISLPSRCGISKDHGRPPPAFAVLARQADDFLIPACHS